MNNTKIFKTLSIIFISLTTCICFSLLTPSITHSSSLKSDCLDNQNCIIIAQEDIDNICEANETCQEIITPASRQIELIKESRGFYGGTSLSTIVTILFMTIGPLKIIPAFVKLTYQSEPDVIKKLALRAFAISTSAIVIIALASQNLLDKYNMMISALIAAAGIVLFLISVKTVLSQYGNNEKKQPTPPPENPLTALISPLTFPTILTPHGIALVMIFMSISQQLDNNSNQILGIIIILMILNLICMLYAKQILNFLKPTVLQVLGLVLGIIQLALAINYIFAAIDLQVLTINAILNS
ncbi:MarC family protein [Hydrocoleum sp. CS-953]|uniref:MarC family protein n=1 Tax=Hydrocoleum sp. CS-953 TaxID=1671698 RepID=UPI000B9AF80A|nr:MarC family protein [Hydrocoleum sp. CS-953]